MEDLYNDEIDKNNYPNLYTILEEYGNDFIQYYRQKLKEHNHNASGQLSKNLRTRIEVRGNEIQVWLEIADYYYWLNSGRGITKSGGDGTVRRKIFQWIKDKNIIPREKDGKLPTQEQLSYMIARKIHNEGYEGDGCFDDTLKYIQNKYVPLLLEALQKDFNESFSIKILEHINKKIKI